MRHSNLLIFVASNIKIGILTTFNVGHNILELYNVLVQIRLATSKTKRDI